MRKVLFALMLIGPQSAQGAPDGRVPGRDPHSLASIMAQMESQRVRPSVDMNEVIRGGVTPATNQPAISQSKVTTSAPRPCQFGNGSVEIDGRLICGRRRNQSSGGSSTTNIVGAVE